MSKKDKSIDPLWPITLESWWLSHKGLLQSQDYSLLEQKILSELAAQQYQQALNQQLGGLGNGTGQAYQTSNSGATTNASAIAAQANANAIANATLAAIRSADNTPKEPLENAGVKFGEIEAYRMWYFKKGYLVSYSQDCMWLPGDVITGKPEDHNEQGIWAFKDKQRAACKMMTSLDCMMDESITVWGSVRLWGLVIEHADGYRAENAEILSLDGISTRSRLDHASLTEKLKKERELLSEIKQKYGFEP